MTTVREDFDVRPSSRGVGLGFFAVRRYEKGDFIVEYTGERITTKVADTLKTRYLFELDEHWTIDGEAESNSARYINHSCQPNAEADIHDGHILIVAQRWIRKGEEIAIDYGKEYFDEFIRPAGCKCASCAV